MTTPLEKQEYIIYKMMYPGLYILAGAPKIGKSWLALDLCMSVANGEQFLKYDIIGSVDGIMVMIEERRGSKKAKLHCAGRDIEHLELNLEFANHRWNVVDVVPEHKPDLFSFAIHDLMVDEKRFTGSATELCKLMYKRFGREYAPNWITRNLVQHTDELKVYGVQFSMRRSHGSRILELIYDQSGDSKNGSLLWVEISDHTGTRNSENVYLPLFEAGDSKTEGDGICGSG